MSKVEWLPESLDDLKRHFDFLAPKNPVAAHKAAQQIRQAGFSLENFPYRGTLLQDGSNCRKLLVDSGRYGYRIIYRVKEDKVVILRIYHGREARSS